MLTELYVYIFLNEFGWVPCGLLEYEEKGRYSSSRFRYGIKYLKRPDAISIDPTSLPLEDTTFYTEEGFDIFNGIRDAGPDKWGRYLLDKKFGRVLNEIEYIAATGPDRAGALAFSDTFSPEPKIYSSNGFTNYENERLDLAHSMGAVYDAFEDEESTRLKELLSYGPSLGGARPKVTVDWKGRPYVAKFSISKDTKNEPLVEYATMCLAKKCGLNVPDIDKIEIDGRSAYLIERFDRDEEENPIPFISGLTITGFHESDYSLWSYSSLGEAILKFSPTPLKDLKELYKRMIFNIMVYNNDDHMRNFGFLYLGDGFWKLSPLYDVVPGIVSTQTFTLAMRVGFEGKNASIKNAISECEKYKIDVNDARLIAEEMQEKVNKWREVFKSLGVTEKDLKILKNSFAIK